MHLLHTAQCKREARFCSVSVWDKGEGARDKGHREQRYGVRVRLGVSHFAVTIAVCGAVALLLHFWLPILQHTKEDEPQKNPRFQEKKIDLPSVDLRKVGVQACVEVW